MTLASTQAACLARDARTWPTPAARDYRTPNSQDSQERRNEDSKRGQQLPNFIEEEGSKLWATPDASVFNDGQSIEAYRARKEREKEKGYDGNGGGTPIAMQARLWSTPAVGDVTGGRTSRSGDRKDELLLNSMARYVTDDIWPTPTATNRPRSPETLEKCAEFRKEKAGQNTVPLYLEEVVLAVSSPQDPETSTDGASTSASDLRLNPRFVEALMGLPRGWTSFTCSEMEFSRWRLAMRSELSRLPLPAAAPRVQLSLFD